MIVMAEAWCRPERFGTGTMSSSGAGKGGNCKNSKAAGPGELIRVLRPLSCTQSQPCAVLQCTKSPQ